MPSYFWMTFESLRQHSRGLLSFNLSVQHNTRRVARICSAEFELWLERSGGFEFMEFLRADIRGEVTQPNVELRPEFTDAMGSRFRVLWHYTPEQLQRIETVRQGGKVVFQIYARLTVQSVWPHPNEQSTFTHEVETPGREGGWPLVVEIAESEWIALLAQIGFKHPIMERLTWPVLPPAFSRAESHLDDAWNYYRSNDPHGTLNSCYKAFECLGFDLFGKQVERKEVFDRLMAGATAEKQNTILAVLRALQNVFHLGRHDKSASVPLDLNDAQMAVVCATALMSYLGTPRS